MNLKTIKNQPYWALLYSGESNNAQHFVAYDAKQIIESWNLAEQLNARLFGYFGYNLRHKFESYTQDTLPNFIITPELKLIEFEHYKVYQQLSLPSEDYIAPKISYLNSNFSDQEYLKNIELIIKEIHTGNLYQANLTRKFFGEFETPPDPFNIFCKLSSISPAPYSAYMRMDDLHIISASPEKFITMKDSIVTTTPIKGTLSASKLAYELSNSSKNKAENLMIVDLMRNDLAKTCRNVKVDKLYEVTTYPQYHHMSSTITATTDKTSYEVLASCFPPGSMTGAPKIAAINLCSKLERLERGIYSGAIGWIEPYACDLSVVIRTIIIKGNKFEFQVGGGVVADSIPEKELEEIYVKATAIMQVLGAEYHKK